MIADAAMQNRPPYNFARPIEPPAIEGDGTLLSQLIATRAFQRLKSVRFLGGIDYILVRGPNGIKGNIRYTRYQHSLGVAHLARLYCDRLALSSAEMQLVCAAALLHDIGHPPFSRSLEPVFAESFGLDHHGATEDLILGRVPFGQDVYELLHHEKIDVECLIAIISGETTAYDGFFSGPITFDTVEGVLRSLAYRRPNANLPSPEAVIEAAFRRAHEKDRATVDDFWICKDQAYRHVVNSQVGILADFACQWYMRRNLDQIVADDYFATESQIFRKLPGLRELLSSRSFEADIMRRFDRPVSYTKRRFFIEPEVDFFSRNDGARYRQTREKHYLLANGVDMVAAGRDPDLFDDNSNRAGKESFGS